MERDLKNNQAKRRKRRAKEKKLRKIKLSFFGVALTVSFSFMYKYKFTSSDLVKAKDTKIVANKEEKKVAKKEQASKGDLANENQEVLVSLRDGEKTIGYSDILQNYKKVDKEGYIYSADKLESRELLKVQPGEYIRTYGFTEEWIKVKHKSVEGFVKRDIIRSVEDSKLKVVDGHLVVAKGYEVPEDFDYSFDIETESALMVMLESMKREGLNLKVGRTYTSFQDEKDYIENNESSYPKPNEYESELRTGLAVELYNENTDPRLDNGFLETEEGKWILENAHKYGFVLRYPADKEDITGFAHDENIFRFVGVDLAKTMYENNLTMEEYFK